MYYLVKAIPLAMPIPNIEDVHDELYLYLMNRYQESVINEHEYKFKFTTRITNRFGRLDKGYWFHGNEHYIAISFWTGTDWMNKTPNIILVFTEDDCYLEISVWDSETKRQFVEKNLVGVVVDPSETGKYYKYIDDFSEGYINILEKFLREDGNKAKIDAKIREYEQFLSEDENALGFIGDSQFQKWVDRIDYYRAIRAQQYSYPLCSLHIDEFPGVDICKLEDVPSDVQCVFITGENGVGKTSILRALGCVLTNDHSRAKNFHNYSVNLLLNDKRRLQFKTANSDDAPTLQVSGYAAYGPYRLMTNHKNDIDIHSLDPNHSLFDPVPILWDIEKGIEQLPDELSEESRRDRINTIKRVVTDLIPGLRGIHWKSKANPRTLYDIEYGSSNEIFEESESLLKKNLNDPFAHWDRVWYEMLASGAKSLVSMIGDMMVRLFNQQPHIDDIGGLQGVVLIDEIDIHLHPIYQKSIVQKLADNFPKVQFVITTHSPIPLLGAPVNSVIYKVSKNRQRITTIKRVDTYIDLLKSNPNLLLTSPVFGLNSLFPSSFSETDGRMRTEDNFTEYMFRQMLEEKLNNLRNENTEL